MKLKISVLFRFLAVFAVVFCGITAILPQTTENDNEGFVPVWEDLTEDNTAYIRTVYKKGLMTVADGNKFGTQMPFSVEECAYAVVRLYESENDVELSFSEYNANEGESYIEKAEKYGIWDEKLPKGGVMTRDGISLCLSKLLEDSKPQENSFFGVSKTAMQLYNCGITLEERVTSAFSPGKELTRGEAAKLIAMYADESLRHSYTLPDYSALKALAEEKIASYSGDWSMYYEDYKTGAVVSVNSHQVYSASLIKLFVAETVYNKINSGALQRTAKIDDEIRKMITYSDNEAWKYLARQLGGGNYSRGMATVTEIAQANGFSDTGQFYQGSHKNYNFTSVNDCGVFLRRVLDNEVVSPEYSQVILNHMKNQQNRTKIPAGIPEGVVIANKTGELDYVQGDAAIVYLPERTYILVVIGDSLTNGYGQISKITELSKTAYEFSSN